MIGRKKEIDELNTLYQSQKADARQIGLMHSFCWNSFLRIETQGNACLCFLMSYHGWIRKDPDLSLLLRAFGIIGDVTGTI